MELHLNLATTPQPNNRPFLVGAVITGAIGVIAFAISLTPLMRPGKTRENFVRRSPAWKPPCRPIVSASNHWRSTSEARARSKFFPAPPS